MSRSSVPIAPEYSMAMRSWKETQSARTISIRLKLAMGFVLTAYWRISLKSTSVFRKIEEYELKISINKATQGQMES